MYYLKIIDEKDVTIEYSSPTPLDAFFYELKEAGVIKAGTEPVMWDDGKKPEPTIEELLEEKIIEKIDSKTEALQQEVKRLQDESKALKDEVEERRQEAEAINDRFLSLTFPPLKGEEWSEAKPYLKSDNITEKKTEYEALKFSRGKRPSENPNYWRKKAPPENHDPSESPKKWDDLLDGATLDVGEIYKHKGKCWKCLRNHKKLSIWAPSENSIYWKGVE